MTDRAIHKTVIKLLLVAIAMFAFVFVVMVPMYNVLCEALGINGKSSGGQYTVTHSAVDQDRWVTIQFIATNNADMPWVFHPHSTTMSVHPGATNHTTFYAHNPVSETMVAQAIPSIMPARAAQYFHKTECFCFEQQPLGGGDEVDMPLQFIIDQDLPADIKTITLSYTLFDVTENTHAQSLIR